VEFDFKLVGIMVAGGSPIQLTTLITSMIFAVVPTGNDISVPGVTQTRVPGG